MEPANVFSAVLLPYEGQLTNPALRDSLVDLQRYLGGNHLPLLSWDDTRVALALTLPVELPPRGPFGGLDIRAAEPVLLVFSLAHYPTVPPLVLTDRLDFPKDHLAHLYVAQRGLPPAFCLVRGSFGEWYAGKRLRDVVVRTGNWLRDAAVGNLTLDGEQFDPLRLEQYTGTVIYPYDLLAAIVEAKASWEPGLHFALALFEDTAKDAPHPAFRFVKFITPANYAATVVEYARAFRALLEEEDFQLRKYHLGYVLWAAGTESYAQYSVDLPQNWEELQVFCTSFGLDLDPLVQFITQSTKHFNIFPETPIICALRRPKQVIGFSATLEFVNFFLRLTPADVDMAQGRITTNVPVRFQAHNEPLTWAKAQAISGGAAQLPFPAFVVGCGALGSKIVMHLARSGVNRLFLLDPDELSPHNLVRHALHAEAEGANKAQALADAINAMYRYETAQSHGLSQPGEYIWSGERAELLPFVQHILDFTASDAFLISLLTQPNLTHVAISRAVISDQGNLGILSLEGTDRNPRLDDLQVALYVQGKHNSTIAAWLRREQAVPEEGTLVTVGVGCNSETTILTDEVVSTHAAYVAQVLKAETNRAERQAQGQLFLSRITHAAGYPALGTERLVVPKREVLTARNDPSWQIRLCPSVAGTVRRAMGRAYPDETGGVFIGQVNYKTKVIHVVDVVLAPPDSHATPVCFFRGVYGLPEAIGRAVEQSGGQLGYVGEWHTHPLGPNAMSETDHATVRRFRREFDELPNPLPVFLLIATADNLLPFVY